MVRYAWIVFGASTCGAATAALFGGASSWGAFLTIGTLVIALTATMLSRLGRSSTSGPVDHVRLKQQRLKQQQFDDDLVAQIRETVGEREIDWLSRQDFESAWRDTPVSALRSLKGFDGLAVGPFGDELRHMVEQLERATTDFLDYYERRTRPDPLLAGTDWREIDTDSTGSESRQSVADRLVQLAAALAEAYGDLFDFQSRTRQRSSTRGTA